MGFSFSIPSLWTLLIADFFFFQLILTFKCICKENMSSHHLKLPQVLQNSFRWSGITLELTLNKFFLGFIVMLELLPSIKNNDAKVAECYAGGYTTKCF